MQLISKKGARLMLATLVTLFAGQAPGADECEMHVKNCVPTSEAHVLVLAFNGNDTVHMVPASQAGPMSSEQISSVSCNYATCDVILRVIYADGSGSQDFQHYDVCKAFTVQRTDAGLKTPQAIEVESDIRYCR